MGTAITTLIRKAEHSPAGTVGFRHLWGQAKLEELTETAEAESLTLYDAIAPVMPLGLPFAAVSVSQNWHDWPSLPDLFPTSFPGVKTSRDAFLIDVDLDRLKARIADYFNSELSHEEIVRRYPSVMNSSSTVYNCSCGSRLTTQTAGWPDREERLRSPRLPTIRYKAGSIGKRNRVA